MPRALVVCEYPTLNGGEHSLLAVLPRLMTAGWTFDAWCPPSGSLAEALQNLGVNVISSLRITGPPTVAARRHLLRTHLETHRYDLVHANSLSMGRLAGPIVDELKIPSIAHLRDIVGLNQSVVGDLNRHTRLLAVSEATRNYHVAQGVNPETRVVYNGVDLDVFNPNENRMPRRIGIVGQLILRKGQDVALTALMEVMRTRGDVQVAVVGARHSEKPETREFEQRLHKLVAEAGMTDRVQFLGTRDDMPTFLPQLTLLLHMARQEPLGRVLLEAAACGVPVVATDVGGTREIFPEDVRSGAILVPVDDADAATKACERVLDDGNLHEQMGIAGRRRVEAAFSAERAADELLRHYNEVALQAF